MFTPEQYARKQIDQRLAALLGARRTVTEEGWRVTRVSPERARHGQDGIEAAAQAAGVSPASVWPALVGTVTSAKLRAVFGAEAAKAADDTETRTVTSYLRVTEVEP